MQWNFFQLQTIIILLSRSGGVVEQGTFEELTWRNGSYIQKLCVTRGNADSTDSVNEIQSIGVISGLTWFSDSGKKDEMPLERIPPPPSRQLGDRRVYLYYFKATGLANTVLFLLYQLFFVGLEYFPTIWLS
jgi:hypothetical protein